MLVSSASFTKKMKHSCFFYSFSKTLGESLSSSMLEGCRHPTHTSLIPHFAASRPLWVSVGHVS